MPEIDRWQNKEDIINGQIYQLYLKHVELRELHDLIVSNYDEDSDIRESMLRAIADAQCTNDFGLKTIQEKK